MNKTCYIFGQQIEYNFLSSWIKYLRMEKSISQEALCYGICSKSHLCYFENGKRTLREDIIEALLKKLGIDNINNINQLGSIRQKLYSMMQEIETGDKERAESIYMKLTSMEDFIQDSLYSLEFKVYKIAYLFFVKKEKYDTLKDYIKILDKALVNSEATLKYTYLLTTGRCIFRDKDHGEGLARLLQAKEIMDTPWVNYMLGFSYCFNNEPLKATYFLNNALDSYEKNGHYMNAVKCHDSLAVCYGYLNIYEKSKFHLSAALNGATYFDMKSTLCGIYINLSDAYMCTKEYEKSMEYSRLAIKMCELYNEIFTLLAVSNYIEAALKSNIYDDIDKFFKKYLCTDYEDSIYYKYLYYLYLSYHHFSEEIFYTTITKDILPFYKKINYIEFYSSIQLKLIEHLELKRKYKEANIMYKDLLYNGHILKL
ncbi:hypothetical protein SAMN02745248_00502 [Hathewaya proteolytica DSM 3090]|uniref:HTH cro/C1-type domain-containing protein n=1 Tax=Hathewaya proteolytica DSM 3090 TaxID=1121331 RepID=A0A1M6KKH2_9CLOT|nr:helix-turn-helix transcriptional regulator [Hathewaya proteolytica]SHJ59429.1 hypothetical protein SAMN02745248_00502 [Hathewaya proteolytica DSM 3090]